MRLAPVLAITGVTCALFAVDPVRPHAQDVASPPLQFVLEPAGEVILDASGVTAEGSLPVAFVRSPDRLGPGGRGRYLVVVNSGYGIQVDREGNEGLQMLQVLDLSASPSPSVVQ